MHGHQREFAAGSLCVEKSPGGQTCWVWVESVVVRQVTGQHTQQQGQELVFNVQAGWDLGGTRVKVAGSAVPLNQTLSSDPLAPSHVEPREELLDAFGDAGQLAERKGLKGVPQGILECQQQALKEVRALGFPREDARFELLCVQSRLFLYGARPLLRQPPGRLCDHNTSASGVA